MRRRTPLHALPGHQTSGNNHIVSLKPIPIVNLQVNKGPVDYVTHEARYSLSEEKLIRQQVKVSRPKGSRLTPPSPQVEYRQVTVFVSMSPQTIYMSGE